MSRFSLRRDLNMTVLLHGLAVDTGDLPVLARKTDRVPDVTVVRGAEPSVASLRATETVIAESFDPGHSKPRLRVARFRELESGDVAGSDGSLPFGFNSDPSVPDSVAPGDAYLIEWPGLTSAEWHPRSQTLVFAPRAAGAADIELLLIPAAIGIIAMLHGALVLHATAIELDGMAIVMMASPGGGKSSIAALACAAGAALISEDVCVIDPLTQCVHVGAWELRLRGTTPWIARLPGLQQTSTVIDDRTSVFATTSMQETIPVRSLVFLQLTHDPVVHVAPLAATAIVEILRHQRCTPVASSGLSAVMFDRAAGLLASSSVHVLSVPWRPEDRFPNTTLSAIRSVLT
jgi:hypothetical protein